MLTVSDLMTVDPVTVSPDTPLRNVIQMMSEENCRQFPVVENGRLVGIITDRDVRSADSSRIVDDLLGRQELSDQLRVRACMSPKPLTVAPDDSAYEVAERLKLYKFGAFPVVEGEILIGIISVSDYLDYVAAMGQG